MAQTKDLELYAKLSDLPENLKKEADDFINYLKAKSEHSFSSEKRNRRAGLAKGLVKLHDDFDEPLDDFTDYMS